MQFHLLRWIRNAKTLQNMRKALTAQRCMTRTALFRRYSASVQPEPIIFDNDAEAKQQKEEQEKATKLKKRKMWTWTAIVTV